MSLILDSLGQRYHVRPSEVMGIDPDDPESILMDIAILEQAAEAEAGNAPDTASGKVRSGRRKWDPAILREIEESKRGSK